MLKTVGAQYSSIVDLIENKKTTTLNVIYEHLRPILTVNSQNHVEAAIYEQLIVNGQKTLIWLQSVNCKFILGPFQNK